MGLNRRTPFRVCRESCNCLVWKTPHIWCGKCSVCKTTSWWWRCFQTPLGSNDLDNLEQSWSDILSGFSKFCWDLMSFSWLAGGVGLGGDHGDRHITCRKHTVHMTCHCGHWPWSPGGGVFVRFLRWKVTLSRPIHTVLQKEVTPYSPHLRDRAIPQRRRGGGITSLMGEHLHKLFGIHLHRDLSLLSHLLIRSFKSVQTHRNYFLVWIIIHCYLLCCSHCSSSVPWVPHHRACPHQGRVVCLSRLLLQARLVCFPVPGSAFSPRSPGSFSWRTVVLDTKS